MEFLVKLFSTLKMPSCIIKWAIDLTEDSFACQITSSCFQVFIFQQFHYNLSPCRAFPCYTTWSLLNFLHIRFTSFLKHKYSDIISPNILFVLVSISSTLGIPLLHISVLMVYDGSLRLCSFFFIFLFLLRLHQFNQPSFKFSDLFFCLLCSRVPLVKFSFLWYCSTSEFVRLLYLWFLFLY